MQTLIDPKSAEMFARLPKPMGMNDSYRELVRFELDTSQRAWMRLLNDMQDLGARWCARRQEMLRDSTFWLDASATGPGDMASAWRRWASSSAQRWIDDVSDQMEVAMKAAARMSETLEEASGVAAQPQKAAPLAPVAKPRRVRRDGADATH